MSNPGQHDITLRRIVSVDLQNVPATVPHDGIFYPWDDLGLSCPVTFDTGETVEVLGKDGYSVEPTGPLSRVPSGSEFGFVSTGTGSARLRCDYWGERSAWIPLQVVP